MKQVFVSSQGEILLQEISQPELQEDRILVRAHYSAISTGTEVGEILHRRANPGGPEIPLGYSLSGRVIGVGGGVRGIQEGDHVACGGWNISVHAEVVSVPQNYAVVVPPESNLRHLAFSTIAAIGLQAVRLVTPQLGEVVVVIGTGIIGQFAAKLCTLSGARTAVIGHENQRRLHIAKNQGAEWTFLSSTTDPIPQVKDITEGLGADAVLHCGKSEVADSLVQALEKAREKGNVVLVGSVPIELPRTPMFRKELNVIVSRSTGPGRYDPHYEREGSDYPPAYVRWTGRRNLAECARLISAGKMGMENLITHEFGFDSAEEAFEHVVDQGAKTLGVLLRYPAGEDA